MSGAGKRSGQGPEKGSGTDAANSGPSAADIVRRIQHMTLLVRSQTRSLMHLRPGPAKGAPPGQGPEFGPRPGSRPGSPSGQGQQAGGPGRRAGQVERPDGGAGEDQAGELGWWVLAQGAALDPEDFQSREAARQELLDAVRRAGVLVPENVWVWDETGRAQLVLASLPTQERAWRVAQRLREKGLAVIVRREMP